MQRPSLSLTQARTQNGTDPLQPPFEPVRDRRKLESRTIPGPIDESMPTEPELTLPPRGDKQQLARCRLHTANPNAPPAKSGGQCTYCLCFARKGPGVP
ncbi:uncharacterized, partial [Tachysurus ichikawai]